MMRYNKLMRIMSLLAIAAAAISDTTASVGPPANMSTHDRRLVLEVGTGERDVDFDGMVGSSVIAPAELSASQDYFAGKFQYGLSNHVSAYFVLGASRMKLGNMNLQAQGISQGVLGMRGEYGLLWGAGMEYVMNPSDNWADLLVGVSAEYRHYTSSINGGKIEVDDLTFAVKGSRTMDKLTPYAGLLYSPLSAKFSAATSLGSPSTGSITSHDDFGIMAGVEYAFSEKISARLEGRVVSSSSVTLGLLYNWSGPWMRRTPRADAPAPAPPVELPPPGDRVSGRTPATPPLPPSEAPAADPRQLRAAEENMKLGNDMVAVGRYDEAIVFYKRAFAMDPNNFKAVYNMATAQYMNRDYAGARGSYEAALKLEPRDVEALLFLGFSNYRLGELDEAVWAWERVLELDPNNAVALNNLQALNR